MRRLFPATALLAALLSLAPAQEGPLHDLVFERWVRDTFFGGYRPASYTQRWDIPASANRDRGGIPVNLKLAKLDAAVDLGEALPQYEIDESFMLIIGFWEQAGEEKRLVNIIAPTITPGQWRKLWGPVTYADLRRLDALIKDPAPTVEETRRRALQLKNSPPFSEALIQVNPRIDDRGQRRLFCSIRYRDVLTHLVPGADSKLPAPPILFGVEYPRATAPKSGDSKQD